MLFGVIKRLFECFFGAIKRLFECFTFFERLISPTSLFITFAKSKLHFNKNEKRDRKSQTRTQ